MAYQSSEVTESCEFATRLQSHDSEGGRNVGTGNPVVYGGDTLEDFQLLQGLSTTPHLVWKHSADGTPEDLGGGTVVSWSTVRISVGGLGKELLEPLW